MVLGDVTRWREMASNQDVGDEVRRNRRRVRVRKATTAEKPTTNSSVDGAAVEPADDVQSSIAVEVPEIEAARPDGSADQRMTDAARVRRHRTPMTTINGSVDDPELASTHELARPDVAANGDVGVHLPTAGDDDMAIDDGNDPQIDDSSAHLPRGAPKKSRGKRRVKNKERQAAEATNEPAMDQPVNGHESDGDWFTAVRNADIAAVRQMAASRAVDVNSTDEVSRNDNSEEHVRTLVRYYTSTGITKNLKTNLDLEE